MKTTTSNTPATVPSALEVVLERTPTGSSIYSEEQASRDKLLKVSQSLQPISRNDWVPACGKKFKNPSFRKYSDGSVSKPRLLRCHNLLRCPDCAARATALQAKALGDALERTTGTLVHITTTLFHTSTTSAYEQLQRNAAVWSLLTRGRAYAALKKKHNLSGSYRTLETTWSEETGFHVHSHTLVILDSDADVNEFRDDWLALWGATATKLGFRASVSAQKVLLVERSEARSKARYLTKVRFPVDALEKAAQGNVAATRAWSAWCAAVARLRTRSTQPTGVLKDWSKRPPAPEVAEEVQVTAEVATVLQELHPELVTAVAETLRTHHAVAAVELLRLHGYPAKAVVHRRTPLAWLSRLASHLRNSDPDRRIAP